jgi:tRNA nucleotidyltransferase (CCA-adding enzyme)
MEKDLRRFMLDPNLLPPNKQTLLSNIAAQAASMRMPCYLVGGFVRDLLLQKPVNDLDVIVEGNAIQLGEALVKTYGGKLTAHHKFNTAIWFLPDTFDTSTPVDTLDIITARSETYKHAGALPTVKPSTIEDDIRRRDFTINAMAVRLDGDHFGELLDPLGGQNDLAHGSIRALHPHSFVDDPTRIFRAVRYEQRYEFTIVPDTLNLVNQEALQILSKLSGERIRHEIDLIFEEESAALMLYRLKELGVLDVFNLPEFNKEYSSLLNSEPPIEFGISANRILSGYLLWFMDSSSERIVSISKRLDFNSELSAASLAVVLLYHNLPSLKDAKPSSWTFHLEKFPLIAVYILWLVTKESALKEFLVKWRHIKPNTTGNDLKARGISPGPQYKVILSQLRAAWLDGEMKNKKEEQDLLDTLL